MTMPTRPPIADMGPKMSFGDVLQELWKNPTLVARRHTWDDKPDPASIIRFNDEGRLVIQSPRHPKGVPLLVTIEDLDEPQDWYWYDPTRMVYQPPEPVQLRTPTPVSLEQARERRTLMAAPAPPAPLGQGTVKEPPPAVGPSCEALSPQGYICTSLAGHLGPHVATSIVDGTPVEVVRWIAP